MIGVPYGDDGLDLDALEQVLARHEVKLVALQTASQNPTGRDMSRGAAASGSPGWRWSATSSSSRTACTRTCASRASRRGRLRELAPGHTIYLSSLSKIVGGGLRIGWIAARGPVLERIARLKLDTDFFTAAPTQHIAAELPRGRPLRGAARPGRSSSTASGATRCSSRSSATWPASTAPRRRVGGHHVWVTLNRPVDERAFYAEAVRHGVTYVPGATVVVDRPIETSLRLSFSLVDPPELDEGVKRLARALREMRRRDRRVANVPLS